MSFIENSLLAIPIRLENILFDSASTGQVTEPVYIHSSLTSPALLENRVES